jgi:hypothetical protein
MSIRIVFQMVVIKKSAVRKHYPDGEAGFRSTYPFAAEDRYLFGLGSMSGGELEEILEELTAAGWTCPGAPPSPIATRAQSRDTPTSASNGYRMSFSRSGAHGLPATTRTKWRPRRPDRAMADGKGWAFSLPDDRGSR